MPILNKSTRRPPLNSLRIIPANTILPAGYHTWPFDQGFFWQQVKTYFQGPANYCQKVESTDTLTIYLDALGQHITITLLNSDGTIAAILVGGGGMGGTAITPGNVDDYYGDQYYTFVYQFIPSDLPLADGIYYFLIKVLYDGDTDTETNTYYVTEPIQVRAAGWPRTMLFEYANTDNDYDVFWNAPSPNEGFTPTPWAFRTEAFIKTDPAFHDTTFEDQNYEVEKLQSITYRLGTLIIGGQKGVPPYVLDKINKIIACDSWTADGVAWKKEPGANWEITDASNSILQSGSIKLRDNPAIPEWEDNNSDGATFRIHTDVYDNTHN